MKQWKAWIMLLICTILFMSIVVFAEMNRTVELVSVVSRPISDQDLKLLETIKQEAKRLNVNPIDAKLDPIWKAIPGYNGRIVDIEQTFYYAKKLKGNIPFVYKEIEPKVKLEQLGPQPIYKGNPHKPMAAIMINVAWGNEYLPIILDALMEANVWATFFLDGSWLKKNTDIAREIRDQGHELSNHAYSHKNMSELSWGNAKGEIMKTQQLLKTELDVDNQLFAPPSGDYDEDTVKLAHQLNLKTILWTIDTLDWKNPEPSWIVRKITARLEPGSLILMHPTQASSSALPQMIKEIKRRGLVLGTVSEVLSTSRIIEVESHFDF